MAGAKESSLFATDDSESYWVFEKKGTKPRNSKLLRLFKPYLETKRKRHLTLFALFDQRKGTNGLRSSSREPHHLQSLCW